MGIIKLIILLICSSGYYTNNYGQQSICFPLSFMHNSEQESTPPKNTRYVKINELTIVNHDLNPILDSIISTEKHRDYYYPGIRFYMNFYENYIIISAGKRYTADDVSGILVYGGHNILVKNAKMVNEDEIKEEGLHPIFETTGKKIKLDFEDKKIWYDKEFGSVMSVYEEDDTFSEWHYEYVNGKFNPILILDTKTGTVTEF